MLIALQDLFENDPVFLSGIAEFDETFILDCFKENLFLNLQACIVRKHGVKATKTDYFKRICCHLYQYSAHDGDAITVAVNHAKLYSKEIAGIFRRHITDDTLILTNGFRSYKVLETMAGCTIKDVTYEKKQRDILFTIPNTFFD